MQAVSLTYHLVTQSASVSTDLSPFSAGVVAFGQGATPVPHDILPGHAVALNVNVFAPTMPGSYRVLWDLQQGADSWFSQRGVLPRVQPLEVESGTPSPSATPSGTSTPSPLEGLRYVADTSFPDGSSVRAGTDFSKGWLVFNSGRVPWQSAWSLRLVSGRPFGASSIRLPALNPCRTANLVASLRAPNRPGQYRSVWQLRDGQRQAVGDRLTLVITVLRNVPAGTPVPTPPPTPTIEAPTPTPTPVG
jgi:hypothetical protein